MLANITSLKDHLNRETNLLAHCENAWIYYFPLLLTTWLSMRYNSILDSIVKTVPLRLCNISKVSVYSLWPFSIARVWNSPWCWNIIEKKLKEFRNTIYTNFLSPINVFRSSDWIITGLKYFKWPLQRYKQVKLQITGLNNVTGILITYHGKMEE